MSSKTLTTIILAVIICISAGVIGTILVNDGSSSTEGTTYSITYELNGGIADSNSPSEYVSGQVTDLGCPTNENEDLIFIGWYTDKECTQNLLYIPSTMSGDLKLYALWDTIQGHGFKMDTYTLRQDVIFGDLVSQTDIFGTYTMIYLSEVENDDYLYRDIRETRYASGESSTTNTVNWASENDDQGKYETTGPEQITLDIDGWNVVTECYTLTLQGDGTATHVEKQYYIYGWLLVMVDSTYSTTYTSISSTYRIDSIASEEISEQYTIEVYAGDGITATGAGTYAIGTTVELTATGTDFLGWYDEAGNLLTTDRTYQVKKVLTDQSFYAYNSKSYDTTSESGETFTVSGQGVEGVTWTLYDSSKNVVDGSSDPEYTYVFDSVGIYTLTCSGAKDGEPYGKILTILADGVEERTYDWSYGGKDYTMTLEIRYSDYYAYLTDDISRSQGTAEHDLEFVTSDDKYVVQVAENMTELTAGLSKADAVNVLLRFTQTIPYVTDTETNGQDEYWKFPLETLYDNGGDCEDTSILFCAVGKAMGYDTALMIFNGHATGAVSITDMGYSSTDVKVKTERVGSGYFSRMISYYVIDNDDMSTYIYVQKGVSGTSSSYYLYCETTVTDDGKGNEFTVGDVPSYTGRAYSDLYSYINAVKVIPC